MKKQPALVQGRHGAFPAADQTLTSVEVQRRFGTVMARALASFSRDPSYLVEMANSARAIERRRAKRV